MLDVDSIAKRLDSRDGFRLVSYREVGLPVFRLSCLLTFQEATPLGAIEEFMLRAVAEGVDTLSSLEGFLGLPQKVIAGHLGRLSFEGAVASRDTEPVGYTLTSEGQRRALLASTQRMIRQRLPLYYDGITRSLIPIEARDLWTAKQLDESGFSHVSPVPRRVPRESDVDLAEVNHIASLFVKAGAPVRRAVRVDALVGRPALMFRKALALAFKSIDGRRVSVGFAIDGRLSSEHEIEFERNGGIARSPLFASLLDADKRRRDVQVAQRELKRDVEIEHSPSAGERKVLSIGRKVATVRASDVRVLSVYDHPPLLRDAFLQAKKRILIVSPWIRASVVNDAFVRRLAECLSRGVRVSIGYGIGRVDPDERDADRGARESLEALAKGFPNFELVRKGNTHAKILLVDDRYFVTTSFNWLSFSGDPRKPLREEEGTMIEDPRAVDSYYENLIARFKAI